MLNLELLAQGGDHSIVKVYTIISDDPFWDPVPTNEILLDETGNNILSDRCEGNCFDPLCKIINSTKMKLCPLEAVGLISPIISISHIAKGQGAVKMFRGTGGTCTLSA